jgi:sulfur relay (sulfurtransferase) complex TusBCD TusD component (DsrE family)
LVNLKMLAILLTSAPYTNQYADHMCRVALRAQQKGYAVEILLYGQGVHSAMGVRSPEDRFPVGAKIKELMENGAKVYGCDTGSPARGLEPKRRSMGETHPSGEVMEGMEIVPISKLVEIIARADRLLSFGGG